MKRGLQTISKAFMPANESEKANKKGSLTDERDECILYRYYFYCQIKEIRFDVALTYLEKEFFISASTITNRLTVKGELLKEIITAKNKPQTLKKKYPQFNWN